jgi:hypothetical protein
MASNSEVSNSRDQPLPPSNGFAVAIKCHLREQLHSLIAEKGPGKTYAEYFEQSRERGLRPRSLERVVSFPGNPNPYLRGL